MRWLASISLLWLASCAPAAPAASRPSAAAVVEARIADGPTGSQTVRVTRDKRGAIISSADAQEAAARALPFLWPPMIDSHGHLAYWSNVGGGGRGAAANSEPAKP